MLNIKTGKRKLYTANTEDDDGEQLAKRNSTIDLKSVTESIPVEYQNVFLSSFSHFNKLQSEVFEGIFSQDNSFVLSAPTASGKTVLFEISIIRILMKAKENGLGSNFKIIYISPIKALINEKFNEWSRKFQNLLSCIEVTGDNDIKDLDEIGDCQLILTTPEKWDSLTRRWRDYKEIVQSIKLFLIDEVHLLNEDRRGSILECIVSRMKLIISNTQESKDFRFICVSATIPNIEDLAMWLKTKDNSDVKFYSMNESFRPIQLEKFVVGFPASRQLPAFRFDMNLNYKLVAILKQYSENKPTLIFCNSRKSIELASGVLETSLNADLTVLEKHKLHQVSVRISDNKLRNLVNKGIAYHHGGMSLDDRLLIENSFRESTIPVLLSTTTLSMGVNLPAHLVIIKSTQVYRNGKNEEYDENTILQMIGRAGRPQFDSKGIAVIMTQEDNVKKYKNLVTGNSAVESNMHRHLTEHINSEIVLKTITNISIAMEWIQSTFLYVRAYKNPGHYGFPLQLSKEKIDKKLEEMCVVAINALERYGLVDKNQEDGFTIVPTEFGRLMSRYYLALETMKAFNQIRGTENLSEMLNVLSLSHEFKDFSFRTNDKRHLNQMNQSFGDGIRFPMKGKIKTLNMKISCLIQACLGNLTITDYSLQTESQKILQTGKRICKCCVEWILVSEKKTIRGNYKALLSAITLSKCMEACLWENSKYLTKQIEKIGVTYSSLLARSGYTNWEKVLKANPRDIERIVGKCPPFGNDVIGFAENLPRYEMEVIKSTDDPNVVQVVIVQLNPDWQFEEMKDEMYLIVGDQNNHILLYCDDLNYQLSSGIDKYSKNVEVSPHSEIVYANLVHSRFVGLDIQKQLNLKVPVKNPVVIAPKKNVTLSKKTKKAENNMNTTITDYFEVVRHEPDNEQPGTSKASENLTTQETFKLKNGRLQLNCTNKDEISVYTMKINKQLQDLKTLKTDTVKKRELYIDSLLVAYENSKKANESMIEGSERLVRLTQTDTDDCKENEVIEVVESDKQESTEDQSKDCNVTLENSEKEPENLTIKRSNSKIYGNEESGKNLANSKSHESLKDAKISSSNYLKSPETIRNDSTFMKPPTNEFEKIALTNEKILSRFNSPDVTPQNQKLELLFKSATKRKLVSFEVSEKPKIPRTTSDIPFEQNMATTQAIFGLDDKEIQEMENSLVIYETPFNHSNIKIHSQNETANQTFKYFETPGIVKKSASTNILELSRFSIDNYSFSEDVQIPENILDEIYSSDDNENSKSHQHTQDLFDSDDSLSKYDISTSKILDRTTRFSETMKYDGYEIFSKNKEILTETQKLFECESSQIYDSNFNETLFDLDVSNYQKDEEKSDKFESITPKVILQPKLPEKVQENIDFITPKNNNIQPIFFERASTTQLKQNISKKLDFSKCDYDKLFKHWSIMKPRYPEKAVEVNNMEYFLENRMIFNHTDVVKRIFENQDFDVIGDIENLSKDRIESVDEERIVKPEVLKTPCKDITKNKYYTPDVSMNQSCSDNKKFSTPNKTEWRSTEKTKTSSNKKTSFLTSEKIKLSSGKDNVENHKNMKSSSTVPSPLLEKSKPSSAEKNQLSSIKDKLTSPENLKNSSSKRTPKRNINELSQDNIYETPTKITKVLESQDFITPVRAPRIDSKIINLTMTPEDDNSKNLEVNNTKSPDVKNSKENCTAKETQSESVAELMDKIERNKNVKERKCLPKETQFESAHELLEKAGFLDLKNDKSCSDNLKSVQNNANYHKLSKKVDKETENKIAAKSQKDKFCSNHQTEKQEIQMRSEAEKIISPSHTKSTSKDHKSTPSKDFVNCSQNQKHEKSISGNINNSSQFINTSKSSESINYVKSSQRNDHNNSETKDHIDSLKSADPIMVVPQTKSHDNFSKSQENINSQIKDHTNSPKTRDHISTQTGDHSNISNSKSQDHIDQTNSSKDQDNAAELDDRNNLQMNGDHSQYSQKSNITPDPQLMFKTPKVPQQDILRQQVLNSNRNPAILNSNRKSMWETPIAHLSQSNDPRYKDLMAIKNFQTPQNCAPPTPIIATNFFEFVHKKDKKPTSNSVWDLEEFREDDSPLTQIFRMTSRYQRKEDFDKSVNAPGKFVCKTLKVTEDLNKETESNKEETGKKATNNENISMNDFLDDSLLDIFDSDSSNKSFIQEILRSPKKSSSKSISCTPSLSKIAEKFKRKQIYSMDIFKKIVPSVIQKNDKEIDGRKMKMEVKKYVLTEKGLDNSALEETNFNVNKSKNQIQANQNELSSSKNGGGDKLESSGYCSNESLSSGDEAKKTSLNVQNLSDKPKNKEESLGESSSKSDNDIKNSSMLRSRIDPKTVNSTKNQNNQQFSSSSDIVDLTKDYLNQRDTLESQSRNFNKNLLSQKDPNTSLAAKSFIKKGSGIYGSLTTHSQIPGINKENRNFVSFIDSVGETSGYSNKNAGNSSRNQIPQNTQPEDNQVKSQSFFKHIGVFSKNSQRTSQLPKQMWNNTMQRINQNPKIQSLGEYSGIASQHSQTIDPKNNQNPRIMRQEASTSKKDNPGNKKTANFGRIINEFDMFNESFKHAKPSKTVKINTTFSKEKDSSILANPAELSKVSGKYSNFLTEDNHEERQKNLENCKQKLQNDDKYDMDCYLTDLLKYQFTDNF